MNLFADLIDYNVEFFSSKTNILILGSHSSGKSSFINWFLKNNVQKTNVAMETDNFTIVCNGNKECTYDVKKYLNINKNRIKWLKKCLHL